LSNFFGGYLNPYDVFNFKIVFNSEHFMTRIKSVELRQFSAIKHVKLLERLKFFPFKFVY
jgi:hypothetical protein